MKSNLLILLAMALTVGQVKAASVVDDEQPNLNQEEIVPVTVTYLDNVFSGGGWDANWMVTSLTARSHC